VDEQSNISAMVDAMPQAALLVGRDSRVLFANAPALELFGAALRGRHYWISLRQPELLTSIEAALLRGEAANLRLDLRNGDREGSYAIRIAPLPLGALCLFEDVSPQTQADQMRRDFVANVSHELRTPLTALQGFIETLLGPAKDDAIARTRFLTTMAGEADRMNRLVADLLNLSRVEAQERLRPETEIDLSATVHLAVDSLRPMANLANVSLSVEGAEGDVFLRADADQMTQVVVNLVENAIKYGSAAGGHVTVSLGRKETPRGIKISLIVQDQGAGIADEHIPRLTERFYRVDSHRSRQQGGTGLGLAIVKHIVSRHRGRLTIESRLGEGSRFSILLPMD
jgi:two-component system, OmpR family, phosphate regulon sensor histidine kinase PhoR